MSDDLVGRRKYFSLAGIIPVAQDTRLFNFPWQDSLMPIGDNYLAIERAVAECASTGCSSIWIICYRGTQSLLRERVGEWVYDPYTLEKPIAKRNKHYHVRRIPIHYIPIHQKDKGRRDCIGFSIAYGVWFVNEMLSKIGKYYVPDSFYISFPMGIVDPAFIKANKACLKKTGKRVFFSSSGKTVYDGLPLSFSMLHTDILHVLDNVKNGRPKHIVVDGKIKRYSKEEAYTARHFGLEDVFTNRELLKDSTVIEVPWYYDIGKWERYTEFIKEQKLERPYFLKYEELNPLSCDERINSDE